MSQNPTIDVKKSNNIKYSILVFMDYGFGRQACRLHQIMKTIPFSYLALPKK